MDLYQNPILAEDYSDPDVIRVGDDYFLTASSFCNVPGLPVLHSKNLVDWSVINYALKKELPDKRYDTPQHGCGVWAPAIRYHEGVYYIFFPMPDEGIFVTKTTDPWGEWSEPICLKEIAGWIDPCPFWDEDGRAYMVHAFAKSRIGFKSKLQMVEISPECDKIIGEPVMVFDGTETQPTIEGPKLYKRNGYYYIFAPAGGVQFGWQTVLRSTNIWGPYEERIVMRQGNSNTNGPHQGAWIDDTEGVDWFYHFQEADVLGRILHLQPMVWKNDWPVIGIPEDDPDCGSSVHSYQMPCDGKRVAPVRYDFLQGDKLSLQWQWNANIKENWYRVENGSLSLSAVPFSGKICDVPNLLLQKWPMNRFYMTQVMNLEQLQEGDYAGLVCLGDHYCAVGFQRKGSEYEILYRSAKGAKPEAEESCECLGSLEVSQVSGKDITLKISVEYNMIQYYYSLDEETFAKLGDSWKATPGRWVGVKSGPFAIHYGEGNCGELIVKDFVVKEAEPASLGTESAKRILWAGDSTVQYNSSKTYPQTGIGQALPIYLRPHVQVLNYAKNGRSTRSFIEEGRWALIEKELKAGDFLFVQFGHNDEKLDGVRGTMPYGDYYHNLKKFVDFARSKGAYPVLITPLSRRLFDEEGKLNNHSHGEYYEAAVKLAADEKVPMVDLTKKSFELIKALGDDSSKSLFMHLKPDTYKNYPEGKTDNTHLQYAGAVAFAGLIAEGLEELGGIYAELVAEEDWWEETQMKVLG